MTRTSHVLTVSVFAVALTGFANAQADPRAAVLDQLTGLLVGDYFSAADGGASEGRPIYMRIRRVEPPPGKRHALYAEMRHDNINGELYRQRLYLFDETSGPAAITMLTLAFEDPAAAARLIENPAAARALKTNDALAPGCDTVWYRDGAAFVGRVDPTTCRITGRRGDQRRIEAVTRIEAASMGQLERGFDLQGKLLFGNAEATLYIWPRVTRK